MTWRAIYVGRLSDVAYCDVARQQVGGPRPRRHEHLYRGHAVQEGKAVQVDPINPKLKLPDSKRLKLKHDEPLSTVALKFNLRRYRKVCGAGATTAGYVDFKWLLDLAAEDKVGRSHLSLPATWPSNLSRPATRPSNLSRPATRR